MVDTNSDLLLRLYLDGEQLKLRSGNVIVTHEDWIVPRGEWHHVGLSVSTFIKRFKPMPAFSVEIPLTDTGKQLVLLLARDLQYVYCNVVSSFPLSNGMVYVETC